MRARTLTITTLATLTTIVALLVLSAGSASALTTHNSISAITEVPASSKVPVTGPISEPWDLALVSGDLYFVNAGNPVVDEFNSANHFVAQFGNVSYWDRGIAVSRATGEVYLGRTVFTALNVFNSAGTNIASWSGEATPSKGFGGNLFVAVDNSTSPSDPDAGDVYVTDSGNKVVDVFKDVAGGKETYVTEITGTPKGAFGSLSGVTVDETTGDVYVSDEEVQVVYVFEPKAGNTYEYLRTLTGPTGGSFDSIGQVAVDPVDGDVYVTDPGARVVYQFTSTGEYVGDFKNTATGQFSEPFGVVVNSAEDVYVSDRAAGVVDEFGLTISAPSATTGAASKVTRDTASIEGTINPEKTKTKSYFEYGEAGPYGHSTAAEAAGEGTSSVPASANLTALKSGTTYYYRTVAENESGKEYGEIGSFTTSTAIENEATLPATGVTTTGATLNGELTPDGLATQCWFEYEGGNLTKTVLTEPEPFGSAFQVAKPSKTVSGLQIHTEYQDRLACENSLGTTEGSNSSFQTLPVVPTLGAESGEYIPPKRAKLVAEVDPENTPTNYFFEYGPSTAYGAATEETGLNGSGFEEVQAEGFARELEADTLYHFRVVAINAAGTVYGPDATFISGSLSPPVVTTGGVSEVTPSSATVEGVVSTQGLITSYGFEVTTNPSKFGPPTGLGSIGAGFSEATATLALHGLKASTTYHYKLLGTNTDGTTEGAEHEFTTTAYPSDQISVEQLPILTEPFVEWPAGGPSVNTSTGPKATVVVEKKHKKVKKHKKGKGEKSGKAKKGKKKG